MQEQPDDQEYCAGDSDDDGSRVRQADERKETHGECGDRDGSEPGTEGRLLESFGHIPRRTPRDHCAYPSVSCASPQ